jgi:hypothetical protein
LQLLVVLILLPAAAPSKLHVPPGSLHVPLLLLRVRLQPPHVHAAPSHLQTKTATTPHRRGEGVVEGTTAVMAAVGFAFSNTGTSKTSRDLADTHCRMRLHHALQQSLMNISM